MQKLDVLRPNGAKAWRKVRFTRSTKAELNVEICSQCHPFYTGKQKVVDTGGRVARFQRRLEKAGRAPAATADDSN